MHDANAVLGILREYLQERLFAKMRNRDYTISVQARLKHALEARGPVFIDVPFGVFQKRQIVKRVNEPRVYQARRTIEVVAMDDVGVAETRFQVIGRIAPKFLKGVLLAVTRPAPREIGLFWQVSGTRPVGVKEPIAECGVQDVVVPRGLIGKGAEKIVSEITAPGPIGPCLA